MECRFKVVGEIKTKQRPRATVINGFARVYTPKDTTNYENYVRSEYQRQNGEYFSDKPLVAVLKAYYKAPENITKYNRFESLACVCHQDLDNLAKIILDSLNGIAFVDDKQVVGIKCTKEYAADGIERVEVILCDFECPSLEDLKKEKEKEKLLARKQELESKPKLTKAEMMRLEEINEKLQGEM